MFELRCPRERMLQQIGVTEDLPVIDGADPLTAPAFLTAAAAHVIVTSKHRYDIVERLKLGLKLQPIRELTDVLIIDHIERPTSN